MYCTLTLLLNISCIYHLSFILIDGNDTTDIVMERRKAKALRLLDAKMVELSQPPLSTTNTV